MAKDSIGALPEGVPPNLITNATVGLVPIQDADGNLLFVHPFTYQTYRRRNPTAVPVVLLLGETPADWLSVPDAARLHLEDIPGQTLAAVKMAIRRAIEEGRIRHNGKEGHDRRLDPESVDAFRLRRIKADLDAND